MSNARLVTLLIVLLFALITVVSIGCGGLDSAEDPAAQMAQQLGATDGAGAASTASAEEVATPSTDSASGTDELAGADESTEGEASSEGMAEGEANTEEADGATTEDDAANGAEDNGETADELEADVESTEATDASAEDEDDAVEEDEAVDEEEPVPAEDEDDVAASEDDVVAAEADEEAEQVESDDPVENFKVLDPRDIIIKKYDDLKERKTEPWNDEDPKNYIPDTGRPDPLTRVWDSVPEDLKPPRAGNTDENEIDSYLVAAEATTIVNGIANLLQCYNVIRIGLEKYVTLGIFGDQFTVQEGFRSPAQVVSVVNNIPIAVTIAVTSVETDEVHVQLTATGQGTSTTVSKSVVYIPQALQ